MPLSAISNPDSSTRLSLSAKRTSQRSNQRAGGLLLSSTGLSKGYENSKRHGNEIRRKPSLEKWAREDPTPTPPPKASYCPWQGPGSCISWRCPLQLGVWDADVLWSRYTLTEAPGSWLAPGAVGQAGWGGAHRSSAADAQHGEARVSLT